MGIVGTILSNSNYLCDNELYSARVRNSETMSVTGRYSRSNSTNSKYFSISIYRKAGNYIVEEFKQFNFTKNLKEKISAPFKYTEAISIYEYTVSNVADRSDSIMGRFLYNCGFNKFCRRYETYTNRPGYSTATIKQISKRL